MNKENLKAGVAVAGVLLLLELPLLIPSLAWPYILGWTAAFTGMAIAAKKEQTNE